MHNKAIRKAIPVALLLLGAVALVASLPVDAASGAQSAARGAGSVQQAPGSTTPPTGQSETKRQDAGQQTPQPQQRPTFRVQADLVTVDAIVRDKKGQFVSNLKKEDFQVLEDGVPQDIVAMNLIVGGRVNNLLTAPPPPTEEGVILPPTRPINDAAGRIYIFFIDDLHIQFNDTSRVRQLLKKMEKTLLHQGDMFAIQTSGPSSVALDLTYDLSRFDDAIKKIAGSELKPEDIIQGPEGQEGPSEVRYRAHVAFSTVNDMLRTLEQVHNRRKALIYVSDGYDFNPFEISRSQSDSAQTAAQQQSDQQQNAQQAGDYDPFAIAGNQFADADLVRELSELTRVSNRANVTMYTVDPRGLVAGPDLSEQVDPVEWMDYINKSQDSLRVLAELTGGFAIINDNDFTKGLQRIDQETSDYYVLGYYSKNPDPLKRRRSIEVKVDRPDVDVWSRKEYTLKRTPTIK
jgi:VWFA-related protein